MPHWLYDVSVPIGTVVLAAMGFWFKDIINRQTKSIVTEVQRIGTEVKVHVAEDDLIHEGIERRITTLESIRNNRREQRT
jgi:hypothetical protein